MPEVNSKIIKAHQPCPCGDSSDAYSVREDGSGYCFSCSKSFSPPKELIEMEPERTPKELEFKDWRGISSGVMEKYGVLTELKDGSPHAVLFPYSSSSKKIRLIEVKKFFWSGPAKAGVFGLGAFKDPGNELIITEGELDAMSAYQMTGYHSVSVRSASSAKADLREDFEALNKYTKIYICFDNDGPGTEATNQVASIFGFHKTFIVSLSKYKDANEYLQNGAIKDFRQVLAKARKYVPEGVTSTFSEIEEVLQDESRTPICDLPFKELNDKLQGIALGESVLWSGLEGIGKTEVLRAIEYKILKDTDYNIGVIHLEESQKATINRLLSYEMKLPLYRSDVVVDKTEKMRAYEKMVRRDGRVFYYSFFGEHDPDTLLGIFRYLVAVCDCKVLLFDHINLVVSSMDKDTDERRALDYLSTRISALLQELKFNFHYVCHANDDGKTRGSRNISQAAHVHVRLERDISSVDKVERNRLKFNIYKNRPTALSGPAGYAWYDTEVGILKDPQVESDSLEGYFP